MTVLDELLQKWQDREASLEVPAEHRSFARMGSDGAGRVLLLHGGGGSPEDLHELADDLAAAGVTALCPRLPAHGRGEAALGALVFADLQRCAAEAYDTLADDGLPVVIIGQSMGAALAIHVAVERSPAGLLALAPALRPYVARRIWRLLPLAIFRPRAVRTVVKWQTEARRGMRAAAARAAELSCPLLILHSDDDGSVDIRGAQELLAQAGSDEKSLEVLHGQGHVLSTAPDRREAVFPRVREFVVAVTAADRNRIPDLPS